MVRSLCLALLVLLFHGMAFAQEYHPDFDCARMDRSVPGQVLVCSDSASARSLLILDQAYYALRHQSPAYMLPRIKLMLQKQLEAVNACFPPGAPVPGEQVARCYRQTVEGIAAELRSWLHGQARQEASRPIEEHIALQRKLQEAGFLEDGVPVDGVYGEATRRAIQRWQRLTGRPFQGGFMGNEDAAALLSSPPAAPEHAGMGETGENGLPAGGSSAPDKTDAAASGGPDAGASSASPAQPGPADESRPEAAFGNKADHDGDQDGTAREKRPGLIVAVIGVILKVIGSLVKMILTSIMGLVRAVIWLCLLPFRLVVIAFHLVFAAIKGVFTNRYVLSGLGILVLLVLFGAFSGSRSASGKTGEKEAGPDRPGPEHEDEEEEAYRQAGVLWFQMHEETGIDELEALLGLLRAKRRRAAFDFLETLLREGGGVPARDLLKTLAAARREDSWKAFQRFSIAMQLFLLEYFGEEEDGEADDEQQARARAYEKARRSGGPPPENAPWYVVLEVAEDASAEEITLSYRRLMKKHHPDRFAGQGGCAYAEAQVRAQKITEAYGYARTLDRFAEPARGASPGRKDGPAGASSGRTGAGGSGNARSGKARTGTADGFASGRDREAYQQAGALWAGWMSELQLPDGAELLGHLVRRELRASFQFLIRTVRPLQHEGAAQLLDEIAAGRNWQSFLRCSRRVHEMLGEIAVARQAEQRREQERKRAEEAERRRQQQERARCRREREAEAAGRNWHVVLEVAEDASNEEIRKAYRALLKKHHPDRFAQAGKAAQEEAGRRTLEITQAYAYVRRYRQF